MTNHAKLPVRPAAALFAGLLLSAAAGAQTWVSLDGSPAGTPAEIVLGTGSNPIDSFLDVFVHGYWAESVAPGDGNVYRRIRVPGLGRIGQEGAPDLPVARLRLAVTRNAASVNLVSVSDLAPTTQPPQLLYPYGVQATDEAFDPTFDPGPGFPDGAPEVFVKDAGIYGGAATWPALVAEPSVPVGDWMDSVPAVDVEIFPARWDPTTNLLQISAHLRLHYSAPGGVLAFPAMSADRATLAEHTFANWPAQSPALPVDAVGFGGRYLIVTPAAYLVTLGPFVQHKLSQGFDVQLVTLESLPGTTCDDVRQALAAWYGASDPWDDHYALLVGDADVLPLCPTPLPGSARSDDAYGSPLDGDLDEEVFVGRLSVDDAADLDRQLDAILAYSADTSGDRYDEALLVAHGEGAPGGYEANALEVAGAVYADAPTFTTLLGSQATASNTAVDAAVEQGAGVLAYRGHGTQTTWHDWNLTGDWHKNDVLGVEGGNPMVVWSLSCWNADVGFRGAGSSVDSLGEVWLEDPGSPAVAHYGSTHVGETPLNDELARRLFEAVFERGITRHAQAVAWAEQVATAHEPGPNAWMGLLLGDPAMRVRTADARALQLDMPETVELAGTPGGGAFTVRVRDAAGVGVEGALVTAVQYGGYGEPPIYSAEAITGSGGTATIPMGPSQVMNPIQVQGNDPDGNEAQGSIGVVAGVWTSFGGALPGVDGGPKLGGEGPLTANSVFHIDMDDGAQNALAALFMSNGSVPTPFKCGTLLAAPLLVPPLLFPTDPLGEVHLAGQWPVGVPADTELWFQIGIQDAAAVCGVSLSNGLRAITP